MSSLLSVFTGPNFSMVYCGIYCISPLKLILHKKNKVKFKQNVQLTNFSVIVWSNKMKVISQPHFKPYHPFFSLFLIYRKHPSCSFIAQVCSPICAAELHLDDSLYHRSKVSNWACCNTGNYQAVYYIWYNNFGCYRDYLKLIITLMFSSFFVGVDCVFNCTNVTHNPYFNLMKARKWDY